MTFNEWSAAAGSHGFRLPFQFPRRLDHAGDQAKLQRFLRLDVPIVRGSIENVLERDLELRMRFSNPSF